MYSKNKNNSKDIQLDFEAKQNIVGFVELLLKVDKRINPDFYKPNKKQYDRYSRTKNPKA